MRVSLDAAGALSAPVLAPAARDPYGDDAASSAPVATPDLAAAAAALRRAAGEEYGDLVPDYDREGAEGAADATDGEATSAGGDSSATDAGARVSRAHQALFLPGGLVATTDLGYDLVRFWRPSTDGLRPVQEVVLPRGSGPRHMRWHPSGRLYVVTELSLELFVLAPDAAGAWHVTAGAPLAVGLLPGDAAAELALSRDARFLYAGVRGSDTIATLSVGGGGGSPSPVALVEAGVAWPRHHLVARDTLLVAGQRSDEVASLTLDERTGVPRGIRHRTAVPSPTCLLPAR